MRTITLFFIATLILPGFLFGQQDTIQNWKLPLKNDLICFDFSKQFENKQRELCSYYTDSKLAQEVNGKISADLISNEGKTLSNKYFIQYLKLFGANENSSDPWQSYPKCDPTMNDTMWGELTFLPAKNKISLTSANGTNTSLFLFKCRFRVIFIGSNKYEISYRGFTVSAITQMGISELPLEDFYNQFVKSEKKKKSDKAFFQDLNGLIKLVNTALEEQLERNIKIAELK